MFGKDAPDEPSGLDLAIADLERELVSYDPGDEAYSKAMTNLERLYKLKEKHGHRAFTERISPDTLIIVGGNLLGIVIIVFHERANVITSKALSFAGKLR